MIVDRRFRGTSVDNHFTRQYNPEDSSEQDSTVFENENSLLIFLVSFKTSSGFSTYF
jgi:hypothetical protein